MDDVNLRKGGALKLTDGEKLRTKRKKRREKEDGVKLRTKRKKCVKTDRW
jgi:hypothetical protein